MVSPITPISGAMIAPLGGAGTAPPADARAFANMLAGAVAGVNREQSAASASIDAFLSGENVEVHQVALAIQRTELAFDLFLQVRNKIVAAYQEVMRMQM